jgi:uncharacterized protein (TIGR03437 family)
MRTVITIFGLAASIPLAQAQNEIVSAGYDVPSYQSVAPGQVLTLFVRGLKVADAFANGTPLPTTLGGIVVDVNSSIQGYPTRLKMFSIVSYDSCSGRLSVPCPLAQVTVQIPTEPTCIPTQFPNDCRIGPPPVIVLNVEQGGIKGQDFPVIVGGQKPRILTSCDTIFGTIGGICNPYITHANGSLIGSGCGSAAKPGEVIVVYAAAVSVPLVISYRLNLPPASPAPPVLLSPLQAWVNPEYVGAVAGSSGLYQINFKVPPIPSQDVVTNGFATMRIAIGAGSFGPSDGSTFADVCVQQ